MRPYRLSRHIWFLILVFCTALPCQAKIDLVTLSDRQQVETTIYKNADLTLVRDSRILQFAKGKNKLQFSWANTRIDPTSLTLDIKTHTDLVQVVEISYPPDVKDLGVWQINAQKACQARVDIVYFTSGLSWESYYTAVLSRDGKKMDLKGYVLVTNGSGEDYARARTRLVLGKISLLDEIAALSGRKYPYGRPVQPMDNEIRAKYAKGVRMLEAAMAPDAGAMPKKIAKQAVSEYVLYTIEGRETIEDGWSRRLLSFEANAVPVANAYTFEALKYGTGTIHRLAFVNDEKSGLGKTPLPSGRVNVYQSLEEKGGLLFKGSDTLPYIPAGKKAKINLGESRKVSVIPKVMALTKENLKFDPEGNLTGFDETRDMVIRLSNFSDQPAALEIVRNMGTPRFSLTRVTTKGRHEKTDQDTITFFLTLEPGQRDDISYRVTRRKGE